MEENIIFLDFDGVITNDENKFSIEAISVLNKVILEYKAKVVVISSMLVNGTDKKKMLITNMLNRLGITYIDFINPNFVAMFDGKYLKRRVVGIIDYLRLNPHVNYIILDDEYSEEYTKFGLNHLQTHEDIGLRREDYDLIKFSKVDLEASIDVSYSELRLSEEINMIKERVK